MSQHQEAIQWSEWKSTKEITDYLLNRTTHFYLRPRKVNGENIMWHLLLAAGNQYHLMDSLQDSMKGRFSKIEWQAIELALAVMTENKSAGPSVVLGISDEFIFNREIKKLVVNLARTKKKLESLSNLERDALVDAGNKFRANPEVGLYAALGYNGGLITDEDEFLNGTCQTDIEQPNYSDSKAGNHECK